MLKFCPATLAALLICRFASAQSSAKVSVPEFVRAGETVQIAVTLDHAPNFSGSSLQYTLSHQGGAISSSLPLDAGQKAATIAYRIPDAAKGGVWSITLAFYDGTNGPIPLNATQQTFTVIPQSGLIYPKSADIAMKPSQVQLLRSKAIAIQRRIQVLKAGLTDHQESINRLLKGSIKDSLADTTITEAEYQELADSAQRSQAKVFFSDIQTSYKEALAIIPKSTGGVEPVSLALNRSTGLPEEYSAIAQSTLRAMEHNEVAYEKVADVGTLSFDLKVESFPPGAQITYGLRGDPNFQKAEDDTNTTIKNLTYAIWVVRVKFPDGSEQQTEHNAVTDEYHVVTFNEGNRRNPK